MPTKKATHTTMPLDVFLERNRWKRALVQSYERAIRSTHLAVNNPEAFEGGMPSDDQIADTARKYAEEHAAELGLSWDAVSIPDHEEREVLRGLINREELTDSIVFSLVSHDGRMYSVKFSREVLVHLAIGTWRDPTRGTFTTDSDGNVSGTFRREYGDPDPEG
jgi:hypothetical protein